MMSSVESRPSLWRASNLLWLAAYLGTVIAIVAAVITTRNNVLRELDTPESRAQWQAWREAEPNQEVDGPVQRRPPSSKEPPALILLRDHFGVMLSAAVVFGSLLFVATMYTASGVFATGKKTASTAQPPARGS